MRLCFTHRQRAVGGLPVLTALALVAGALTCGPAHAAYSITVPTTASLGSLRVGGGTLAGSLGTVTVSSDSAGGSWAVTVISTTCTTGSGRPYERISSGLLQYRSGAATATTGPVSVVTPGQPAGANTVTLAGGRRAFSATAARGAASSVSWSPTLTVTVPTNVVVGTYSCTIMHSVA
ncbi:hypothetical protein MXD59_05750 [Frankia sp. Ag45/Mut15]|uniref:Ig-like domain-containing protein n=1 Tax=Frankia umida TaxID=573489 RepID=A0ABT0JUR4_9ACTN|nr:hypothetical protein [Frankia umida]MCK9875288.1 hypothetical protein [Frankia umida]